MMRIRGELIEFIDCQTILACSRNSKSGNADVQNRRSLKSLKMPIHRYYGNSFIVRMRRIYAQRGTWICNFFAFQSVEQRYAREFPFFSGEQEKRTRFLCEKSDTDELQNWLSYFASFFQLSSLSSHSSIGCSTHAFDFEFSTKENVEKSKCAWIFKMIVNRVKNAQKSNRKHFEGDFVSHQKWCAMWNGN